MPTFEEHRQKCDIAKSAQLTLQAANPHEHADWIIIAAFYQALHWVDAFFALDNYHPGAHNRRKNAIFRYEDLRLIRDSYTKLYDASIDARYEPETFKDARRKRSIEFVVVVDRIRRKLSSQLSHIECRLCDEYTDWFFGFEHISFRTFSQQSRDGYTNPVDEVEALLEEDLASIVAHINGLIDQSQT